MFRGKKLLVSGIVGMAMMASVVGTAAAAPATPTADQQCFGCGRGAGVGINNASGRGAGFATNSISGPVALSKLLGMTSQEIQAERYAGKSLGQIADSKGVSRDAVVNAMLDSRKAILDARVKAGSMTQAQEDAALATMKTRITQSLDRTEVGPNRPTDGTALGLGMGARGQQLGPQDGTGYGPMGRGVGRGMR